MDAIIPTIFQSTHPSGVRPPLCFLQNLTGIFQSTHPSGVRPVDGIANFFGGLFQSTHPSGVRPACSCNRRPTDRFQSTHPSGVRPASRGADDGRRGDFNPRTPVGCDDLFGDLVSALALFQSTHPSGVRRRRYDTRPHSTDFNPRTPVGCDRSQRRDKSHGKHFNPRTPVGCDLILRGDGVEVGISIHAPQWGATRVAKIVIANCLFQSTHPSGVRLRRLHHPNRLRDFNPRTPVGCDVICIPRHCRNRRFQSTHPSGVRLPLTYASCICQNVFQSTHPSGVRPVSSIRVQRPHHISIHAPQWGATERLSSKPGGRVISIHAPQWGATGHINIRCTAGAYFNPRTPVGCDLTLNRFVNELILFQSTHPSGVRQARRHQPRRKPCYFNPRTPVGCDDHRVLFHALERISIHAPQWGAT